MAPQGDAQEPLQWDLREKGFSLSRRTVCLTLPPPHVLLRPVLMLPGQGGKHVRRWNPVLFCFELCLRCCGERENQTLSGFSSRSIQQPIPLSRKRRDRPCAPAGAVPGSSAARGSLTPSCATACSFLFTVGP